MHIGLVAARISVAQLREAFSRTWTRLETVACDDNLADPKAMWAWKQSHEKFVSAADWTKDNPGTEVYLFWQDGPWATMMDESYVLASDAEGLKTLSAFVGTVVSFVVETAGGCADFLCFADGKLRRRILYNDGVVSTEGEPIPEEAGIDISSFYMDETEALWKALGMSGYEEMPTSMGCSAICVIDRTDYGNLELDSECHATDVDADVLVARLSRLSTAHLLISLIGFLWALERHMGLFDWFRKAKPHVPLEQLSYDVAYFVLPHYAFNDAEKVADLCLNTPAAAGPFFYFMACQMRKVEPNVDDAKRFSWHHGQLGDGREYFGLEYPTPPAVDMTDVAIEEMVSGKTNFVLAPYFSAIIRGVETSAYYILGQSPMGGGTTLRTILPEGATATLAQDLSQTCLHF